MWFSKIQDAMLVWTSTVYVKQVVHRNKNGSRVKKNSVRAWYLHYKFKSRELGVFILYIALALVCCCGLKLTSHWSLLTLVFPDSHHKFLRQTGEQTNENSWRFASKALFWSRLKHKCKCVCTVLLEGVLICVVLLAGHHTGYCFIWERWNLVHSLVFLWLRRLTPFTNS